MSGRAKAPATALALLAILSAAKADTGFRAVYGSPKSWDEAQKQCQAWGGALLQANITDSQIEARLEKIKCSNVLWVGAYEDPKAPGVNLDGWKWVSDGSRVSTSVWQEGEPNNYKDKEEECGVAGGREADETVLWDAPCEAEAYFACEIPTLDSDELVWLSENGDTQTLLSCDSLSDDFEDDFYEEILTERLWFDMPASRDWFLAAVYVFFLASIATCFVVIYGCKHDTSSGKCCPCKPTPGCTGGAFCTRQDSQLMVTRKSDTEVAEETAKATKEQLDTKALDGLRGLAAFHVMISHYSADALGLDLLGTMAMGLFYTLTGFVLYIGYARAPLADPVDARVCRVCCCIGCCASR